MHHHPTPNMSENPAAEIESFEDCDRAALTSADVDEMRGLLERHFEGVSKDQFELDLAEKTRVLRVWKDGQLVGFSTVLAYQTEVSGGTIHVIYSGDTIMAPEAWGSSALARGWIRMVKRIQSSEPAGKWPRPDVEMPGELRELRNTLARARFGDQFDESAGLVRFERPQWLCPRLASVPEGRIRDEHVAFFFERNPRWREGDELVCLTELHDENLTAAGRRIVRSIDP
jgi:hypothetical protein